MKIASTTFLCDASQCQAKVTVHEEPTTVAAYLAAVDKGWMTDRAWGGWKHYCPDHLGPKGAPTEATALAAEARKGADQ